MRHLLTKRCWVFDMDGTLTRPIHDFEALRLELGLPAGVPVLEALERTPEPERTQLRRRLRQWERDLADQAQAAPDAVELLEHLAAQGARVGVLTRNTLELARRTLEVTGMARFFHPEDCLGRTCTTPKPAPDGIHHLLTRWAGHPEDAVMVGDYVHDVRAGRAAGVFTVFVDRRGQGLAEASADVQVHTLWELID